MSEKSPMSIMEIPAFVVGKLNDDEDVNITLSKDDVYRLLNALAQDMRIVNADTSDSKKLFQNIVKDLTGINFDIVSAYDGDMRKRTEKENDKKEKSGVMNRLIKRFF
jgi:hypothetical protein